MTPYQLWISFYTIVRQDIVRMLRIWVQTLLPSVITSTLYFLVFGHVLGTAIGSVRGYPYLSFIVPGLVMLAIVTTSYANSSFTFFMNKFFVRSIDELLVSPTPPWLIVAGFVAGGVVRGLAVGTLVLLVSLFFTGLTLAAHNLLIILGFATLTALLFSLAGLVNGIYAKSIDGINVIPTFVLTPLVYLGGIFYSVHALPSWGQAITKWNPLFYLVNGFRYGFLGFTDVSLVLSMSVLLGLCVALIGINWYLIRTGLGLKQ
jgi:ABC-2 type transport system permease protein